MDRGIHIVEVQPEHLPQIESILERLRRLGYQPDVVDTTKVAVCGDTVVGAFKTSTWVTADGTIRLAWMAVAEEARGWGVGDVIVAHVLSAAAHEGFKEIELTVRPTNEPAVRLYLRHGFRFVDDAAHLAEALMRAKPHPMASRL